MFFAAKEAVEKRAFQRGQSAGIDQGIDRGVKRGRREGRREEQDRIVKLLAKHGVAVSPELARDMADDRRDEGDGD